MIHGDTGLQDRPGAFILRRLGSLLFMIGLGLNIWMLTTGEDLDMRLALLVLSPGFILLFAAFLVANTPSIGGCLTILAILMAFMAGFWAWVGVTVALSPEDEPPEILREIIEPDPDEEPEEDTVTPEDEAETPGEPQPDDTEMQSEE